MKYEINGRIVESEKELGEDEIDEIANTLGAEQPKMSFKGLLENIGKELVQTAEVVKKGAYDLPKTLLKTPVQLAQGKSFGETDLGKESADIANSAPAVPGMVSNAVQHPIQTAYENPLTAASLGFGAAKGAASLAKGALSATKGIGAKAGAKIGGALESAGARGQNFAAGLRPQTIEAMTRAGQNPGEIGTKVGAQLAKERIIGSSPTATYNNLRKARGLAGEEVGSAVKAINQSGVAAVRAETALEPLLTAIKERTGAITSAKKSMAKPFQEVYNYLLKQSKENEMLSLDEVKKAMKEVGPMTSKGSEEVQAAMSELYGTLANVQDHIVTQIANGTKNPALKSNLLKANEKFSLYSRITPDLKRLAAKESVGKTSFLASPVEATKKFLANQASGIITRTGTSLKGFQTMKDNATLQSLKARLANAQ